MAGRRAGGARRERHLRATRRGARKLTPAPIDPRPSPPGPRALPPGSRPPPRRAPAPRSRRPARALVAVAALLAGAAPARAQLPGLTASFLQPTGTGTPTSRVDVWVRLTLAADAAPLHLDGAPPGTGFGLPAGMRPTTGTRPGDPARPSFVARASFALAPGAGFDVLYGTFSGPRPAPPPARSTAAWRTAPGPGTAPPRRARAARRARRRPPRPRRRARARRSAPRARPPVRA